MTQRAERKTNQPPRFGNEQEAGDFWDTHSPEEFPGAFREVQVSFDKPLIKRGLTVKLSDQTLDELRERAKKQGIGPSTLARMWILEHLRRPQE
jgi:hypothetical protein